MVTSFYAQFQKHIDSVQVHTQKQLRIKSCGSLVLIEISRHGEMRIQLLYVKNGKMRNIRK